MNLKTIAEEAGVSKTTVSNVINGNFERVSEKTRQKVERIIKEHDYQPNAMAKGLASKESRIIGLVVPNVDETESFCVNPYDVQIIGLLEKYIRKQGYFLMLRSMRQSIESIPLFSSWNVDGMIFFGTFKKELEDIKKGLKVPAVFFDTYAEGIEIANVGIDDYQAGYLSAAYLIGKGHRKIGFVGPNCEAPGVMQNRFYGFRDACAHAGIDLTPDRIFEVDTIFRNGVATGQKIATQRSNFTALGVMADTVALGILEGLQLCGVRVPEDISVLGFDNLPEGNYTTPKLSSISQHLDYKVEQAGEILFQMIREKKQITVNKLVDVEIVERQSVKERSE